MNFVKFSKYMNAALQFHLSVTEIKRETIKSVQLAILSNMKQLKKC